MKKLLLSFFIILSAFASKAQWTQTSDIDQPNSRVLSMAKLGNTVFVGTYFGLYKTSNNGTTWTHVTGLVDDVPIVYTSGNNLYVATNDAGIYLSTDGGLNWTDIGLPTGFSTIGPTSFAVGSGKIFIGEYNGLDLSNDGGLSWTVVPTFSLKHVEDLALNGNNVFAATLGSGVYYSSNLGITWVTVNNGMSATQKVYALKFNGSSLIAGTNAGIFVSTNLGTSWTASNSGLPAGVTVLSIEVSSNLIFIGTKSNGVYYSSDNGTSWTAMNSGLNTNKAISELLANTNKLFAGTADTSQSTLTGDGVYITSQVIGINEQGSNDESISIYPNPSKINFTISSSEGSFQQIEIFNLLGERVYSKTFFETNPKQELVNCQDFANGVYFAYITTNEKASIQKLVIQK